MREAQFIQQQQHICVYFHQHLPDLYEKVVSSGLAGSSTAQAAPHHVRYSAVGRWLSPGWVILYTTQM